MNVHTLINAPAESIAGNSWYGSCLTVSLFHGERGLVAIRNESMFPQPLQMESVSPIIDKSLIRSSNVVPRTIMPTIPHYQLPSPRSPQIPTPAVTTHHTHRSSNSGLEVLDSFSRHRSGSVQSQLKHFARSAKITPTSSVVALVGQYAGITIEQLQDQACQIARLYQPSQDGQVWMNHTLAYSSLWNSSVIPPSVTAFSGLQPQTVMPYPVTYTRLASFASPPAQTHAYHTNPNGTVVNTSWGTIPINDSRAVLIRNIHHEATPQAIKAHFATVGEPESCEINTNSSNRRKCSALLTFRTAEEARAAVSQFHSTKFLDREIQAEVAKEDNSASGGRRTLSDASSTRSGQGPIIANGSDVDPGESGSVGSSQSGRRRERRKEKGKFLNCDWVWRWVLMA